MIDAILEMIFYLFYLLLCLICKLVQNMYEIFEVFAGLRQVVYNGENNYLINVIFGHSSITKIFWGMAAIGVVLCFAFGIVAVIRKMFDSDDKIQTTMGAIVGSVVKGIMMILLMNFFMVAVLNASNLLIQQVDHVFSDKGKVGSDGRTVYFTDKDYATMARIYNTIGNYALNASYKSRYNINCCYNDIRPDLVYLYQTGFFDYDYIISTSDGQVENWQSVLVPIGRAVSLSKEMNADDYNENLNDAMIRAMEILQTNAQFRPLENYVLQGNSVDALQTRMDGILFLSGTMNAARNEEYNKNPSIMDSLRQPYMVGQKNMYDSIQVKKDFSFADIDYLSTIVCSVVIGYQFFVIAINCVARIFNMMLLYLVAPLFIGASPLDDGGKMKQWGVAFTVQSLSVIGSIIVVRLLLVFIPVISSNTLVLFPDSAVLDFFARVIFLVALVCTASKATGMIGGILSDSAGWQAISAGDVGSGAPSSVMQGVNSVLSVGKAVNSIGKSASSLIGKAVGGKKGEVPKNKSGSSSEKDKNISEKSENASGFQSSMAGIDGMDGEGADGNNRVHEPQNQKGVGKGKDVKVDDNLQEGNRKEPENKNKVIDDKDGKASPQNQNDAGEGRDGQGKEIKGADNPQEGKEKEPENKNKVIDDKDGKISPQNQNDVGEGRDDQGKEIKGADNPQEGKEKEPENKNIAIDGKESKASPQNQNDAGEGRDDQGKEIKGADNPQEGKEIKGADNPQEGKEKEPENKNEVIDGKESNASPNNKNDMAEDGAEHDVGSRRTDENARQPENRAPEHVLNYTPGRKTRRRPPKSRGKWKDL